MAGPNSAPNGDRSLMDGTQIECKSCGQKENEWMVNKRNHLATHGNLRTGKTK